MKGALKLIISVFLLSFVLHRKIFTVKQILTILLFFSVFYSTSSIFASNKKTENTNKEIRSENSKSIQYSPVLVSNNLSKKVNEQSGLVWYQDLFWVNNDSDCAPSLYAYNKIGDLKKEVQISNFKNIDWEDVTDDKDYIYIGDFGNNYGARKNLRVLRVSKSSFGTQHISSVEAEEMPIAWADQDVFAPRKQNHDYDCEAFVEYSDSLYFFSKNWADHKTRMYVASKELKAQNLKVKAKFDADLMITGADISSDGKVLALVGYKNYRTYVLLFSSYKGTDFFSGKHLRLDLNSLGSSQTEAIVFGENDALFISTEETKKAHAIYEIEWQKWADKLK